MGVHVGVGQQAELFELVAGEEVGFVEDEDDGAAAFVFFGGEQFGGLGDEAGFVEVKRLGFRAALIRVAALG